MERLTQHDDIQALLGAYALDAVEPEEQQEIERHLATCPRCRAEVADHREVAALLGYAGSAAPPGVWDRIVLSLEEPPPALQLTRVMAERPTSDPTAERAGIGDPGDLGVESGDAGPGPGAGEPRPGGRVTPIAGRRRTIGVRAFAALAAIAALVAAALGIEVARLNNRTNRIGGEIGSEAIAAAYRSASANPGARRVTMRSPADGSYATSAVILPDGTAYLDPAHLPHLPANQTYQLWGVIGQDKVSLAVIGNVPHLLQFGAPQGVSALAITAEHGGGVVVSQNKPVVVGAVPTSPSPQPTLRNALSA